MEHGNVAYVIFITSKWNVCAFLNYVARMFKSRFVHAYHCLCVQLSDVRVSVFLTFVGGKQSVSTGGLRRLVSFGAREGSGGFVIIDFLIRAWNFILKDW